MAKVTKLYRNKVDDLLEEVLAMGLTQVMLIGKHPDGDVVSFISETTTCETLCMGAQYINHEATQAMLAD